MTKTLAILNPISGNGNGARVEARIQAALRAGGLDFDWTRTSAPYEAIVLAEEAMRRGYQTLISIGGDGTVNEIVNGMLRASKGAPTGTLGIISVGSGNDFIKSFSPTLGRVPTGKHADWQAGVRRVLAGETRRVDVGQVVADQPARGASSTTLYFANCLDTGFGAQVAMHAHDFPFLQGTAMYLAAVFKTLIRYAVPRVQVDLDEAHIEQASTMIAVANGRCIGGGFWVAPEARNDDGLLDVMIAAGLGRVGILTLLPKVMQGTHLGDPRVQFARAARVVIESPDALTIEADGEIPFVGVHRVEVEVLPKRLQVIM